MAYGVKYYSKFKNAIGENYEMFFAYDGYSGSITTLTAGESPLMLNRANQTEELLSQSIISTEAVIQLAIKTSDNVDFEDFLAVADNSIYVYILKDSLEYIFHGWVVAEEGAQELQDPPFELSIRCTDGLGLLKTTPLTTPGGTNFTGRVSLINIIGGALSKANADLHIRTWCNIYESSMNDRGDDPSYDMLSQAKVDWRTFLKNARENVDCYEALEIILKQHFVLYYHGGYWNVLRVGDLQGAMPMSYVEYDVEGSIVGSGTGDTNLAAVGKSQGIYLINADATKSVNFARKKARINFMYEAPENLVNNEKITSLGNFLAPLSGSGYAAYELVGWQQFKGILNSQTPASAVNAYIKTEFNNVGYELERYYVIEHDPSANAFPLDNYIRNTNTDCFMHAGDRFSISVETRMKTDQDDSPGTHECVLVALLREGFDGSSFSHWLTLANNGFWTLGQNLNRALTGKDLTEWETISVSDSIIPVDGTIYIWLGTGGVDDGNEAHFRNLTITYEPWVSGTRRRTKGDYNEYSQNANRKNVVDETVTVSDSPKRLIKGALFRENGTTLTTNTWYRYGVAEQKRYAQLVAQAYYNLTYRNFRKVQGTLTGISYPGTTSSSSTIALHTKFEFTDINDGRQYVCFNPRIDVGKGEWQGTLVEIFKTGENDGDQNGDAYEFNFQF